MPTVTKRLVLFLGLYVRGIVRNHMYVDLLVRPDVHDLYRRFPSSDLLQIARVSRVVVAVQRSVVHGETVGPEVEVTLDAF